MLPDPHLEHHRLREAACFCPWDNFYGVTSELKGSEEFHTSLQVVWLHLYIKQLKTAFGILDPAGSAMSRKSPANASVSPISMDMEII